MAGGASFCHGFCWAGDDGSCSACWGCIPLQSAPSASEYQGFDQQGQQRHDMQRDVQPRVHYPRSGLGAGLLEHQAALNELALTDEQQPEPQRSSMDDTSAWMAQMEQQLVLSTADRARVLAQAAAASPALDRSSVKPGDKLCKRADPSSTGDVLKLHDEMDMAQVDFSEAGGSKVRMLDPDFERLPY